MSSQSKSDKTERGSSCAARWHAQLNGRTAETPLQCSHLRKGHEKSVLTFYIITRQQYVPHKYKGTRGTTSLTF